VVERMAENVGGDKMQWSLISRREHDLQIILLNKNDFKTLALNSFAED